MRSGIIPVMLMFVFASSLWAQTADTVMTGTLDEVVVSGSYKKMEVLNTVQQVEVVEEPFLREHFTGNLTQTLGHIPGVHSMDIGAGFSKPMIRGMGFNRISVVQNGIKQEGQQWGADHGLEIDAFSVGRVTVRKGPSSLLYGSDAMGGTIEIERLPAPIDDQWLGEVNLLGKSVNNTLGASLMLGLKRKAWFTTLRYSEQHFGDYHIPTDTVVYLTQRLPIEKQSLKNTAGFERDANWDLDYRKGRYYGNLSVSDAYQKVGFFAGAHGIPDAELLHDDGDSRNIDLPYSWVNHLKVTSHHQYGFGRLFGYLDLGFQNNHREEWSYFHTHYGTQTPPEKDPNKELQFSLNTYSASLKVKRFCSNNWENTIGLDFQYQKNTIDGYSFLLPEYDRFTSGVLWLSKWKASDKLSLSGGLRYDYGHLDISAFKDLYLEQYLTDQHYGADVLEDYEWRSYAVERDFGDVSGSVGCVWNPTKSQLVKVNVGRSFRLPGANELASNGMHHGTFRHEQGDASLSTEKGWQMDLSYTYEHKGICFIFSPFGTWFNNYIYLKPTGEWSILPHTGQIYRYLQAEVTFIGAEAEFSVDFLRYLNYKIAGEYVHSRNREEQLPLPFSPPASMRNTLTWKAKVFKIYAEWQAVSSQNEVSRNEETTPGHNLWNMGASANVPLFKTKVELTLSAQNLLNEKYYNHLSFYRKMEIPEPGRNFQLLIKVPFKSSIK